MDAFKRWLDAQPYSRVIYDYEEELRGAWNAAIRAAIKVCEDEARNPYSHGAGDAHLEVMDLISLDPPPR